MGSRLRRRAAAAALLALLLPGSGTADLYFAGGAGGLVPWEGRTGYSAVGQVLVSALSKRLRIGGEFEYLR